MSSTQDNSSAQVSQDQALETKEWLDALEAVVDREGPARAHDLIEKLIDLARRSGAHIPFSPNTAYENTIPPGLEPAHPGNLVLEERIRSYIRWNAMAMVVRANRETPPDGGGLGGHIASFASLATMIGCGQNHFWHAETEDRGGDMVFFQGHSSPGIYARAFMEGRISEEQLNNFRQEVDGKGLPSYPHPKLMPEFWQFPTVSMGLGPLMAIYQARFLKYLHARGIADTSGRKVWVFLGDGEMDEPESLGAIGLAAREKLDNLIFIVNCNLQRLDGPVRGNGKIIQELEGTFRGAGWNVLKLIWGGYWDPLLARDKEGILRKVMEETVDGEYQAYKANDGAYVREHFFGKHPKLLEMVSRMSDEDIWRLNRGGHDPHKVYAAFDAATKHEGQPTVILAKTIKGYGMGHVGQAKNPSHQQKSLDLDAVREFRDRFNIPVPDDKLEELPYFKPADDSPEMQYLHARRQALGGYLPKRRNKADEQLTVPTLDAFKPMLEATAEGREISTTQAFVRFFNTLLRDKQVGPRAVPILADESRTFGMEGLFRQIGIYAPEGQKYTPVDKDQVMYYRETANGQLLQEGINEQGAFSSWIAAATSYSNSNRIMIPFFIYYSMFGFQRFGDLAWAAGDMKARGFVLGGTAGRTTLNGEGLQHEDGHSHIQSSLIPNCVSYDPTFAHEVAVIMQHGLKRMVQDQEDVYYYVTLMNENYAQPGLVEGDEEGILRGMYKFKSVAKDSKLRVQLMGSGTILREVIAAQELLEKDWGIGSDVWSVTSFTELRRDGLDCERAALLNPEGKDLPVPYVTTQLAKTDGPIVVSTDYIKAFGDQIRPFVPKDRTFKVLGTDGFGRSDYRFKLREHFEVDRHFVVLAALRALAEDGKIPFSKASEAIAKYGINPSKANPHHA
ncbi:pyruvate dehydrogenase (acetyl-transferring), homodimeric type [Alcaligenes faecalis]|jgi:pyruvate dehydrogenase E1 component|uniref:pyruvate dehydrogenase (acetyl-transferring), homodimeric type n=1 Tax=Alcaligenes TaxID=507 RepID=UPI0005A90552|nr:MULTISPECIES: pyruvate dehydrogenase (acetyl-transferring), homodimeric type [Alcaligenes]ALO36866.1 pyruvate dehydrogenase [Alcaligenes faecalis]ARP53872.1 pyruvate dehydrogenase [Alcaligenes faecalis]ATH99801.1 pyruvate dehydrogenase (acetyl-transferring), homodimeric type [Alcaligenes faecalis]AYZ92588.1 pyruvate dehydrogenase (acetyl-transferring), homodimeric type [Alcaligenes faecalis]KAA1284172.1 pyruvate dehydrogenase (acetyl-transferring), homodimeric type [Alcaligenes faecalis]